MTKCLIDIEHFVYRLEEWYRGNESTHNELIVKYYLNTFTYFWHFFWIRTSFTITAFLFHQTKLTIHYLICNRQWSNGKFIHAPKVNKIASYFVYFWRHFDEIIFFGSMEMLLRYLIGLLSDLYWWKYFISNRCFMNTDFIKWSIA